MSATENVEEMLQSLESYRTEDRVYELVDGVRLGLRPSLAGDAVYLMKVRTETGSRNQGAATEALRLLCEAADEHGAELFLEVEPFDEGSLSTESLVAWYRRFGFEGDADEMIRQPK